MFYKSLQLTHVQTPDMPLHLPMASDNAPLSIKSTALHDR